MARFLTVAARGGGSKWGGEMIAFSEGGGTTVTTNDIGVKYSVIQYFGLLAEGRSLEGVW